MKHMETFSPGERPSLSQEKGRRLKIPISSRLLRLVERGNDLVEEGKPLVSPLPPKRLRRQFLSCCWRRLLLVSRCQLITKIRRRCRGAQLQRGV